jgi:hypothetical protein
MEEKKTGKPAQSFWMFVAKAIVITILLALFLDAFIPDFSQIREDFSQQKAALKVKVANAMKDERTKLYALSFVQNPAALYKTSELAERDGKLDNAMRDMELAIGLLEMHGADKAVIKRYSDRLEKLKVAVRKRP